MTENIRKNALGQAIGAELPEWSPRSRPAKTAMKGEYCWLEPLNPEIHGAQLFKAFVLDLDAGNWTYLPYGPFDSVEPFMAWLKDWCCGDDPLFYAVVDSSTGEAVGMASYLRIEPAVGVIEVGHIHFSPLMQRTPMSTEAMFLMMQRVFDELGYRRYEWKCDNCNGPSKQAAERLGFSFEGVFRQATIYKGRNRDTAWFSILDSEWPRLKQAFQAWLHPDNFDSAGQRKRALQDFLD